MKRAIYAALFVLVMVCAILCGTGVQSHFVEPWHTMVGMVVIAAGLTVIMRAGWYLAGEFTKKD